MDRPRKASPSTADRRPLRQKRTRGPTRTAVKARTSDSVVITHPDKVLFPEDGITKGQLAAYYEALASIIVPHLHGPPVTMERFPAWLERIEVPKKDGVVHHPVITDTRSLMWVTNQNTITQHVWVSRLPDL